MLLRSRISSDAATSPFTVPNAGLRHAESRHPAKLFLNCKRRNRLSIPRIVAPSIIYVASRINRDAASVDQSIAKCHSRRIKAKMRIPVFKQHMRKTFNTASMRTSNNRNTTLTHLFYLPALSIWKQCDQSPLVPLFLPLLASHHCVYACPTQYSDYHGATNTSSNGLDCISATAVTTAISTRSHSSPNWSSTIVAYLRGQVTMSGQVQLPEVQHHSLSSGKPYFGRKRRRTFGHSNRSTVQTPINRCTEKSMNVKHEAGSFNN